MQSLFPVLAIALAYLVGSLSFAVIVSRALRLDDPRSYGSRNPGATNVLRSGHRGAAALTLALDALKGFVPVALASAFGGQVGLDDRSVALVGLAAFLGHLWPVFFGFTGGKGVATAAGVLLGLNPWLGGATIATWVVIAAFFRYSSLAALVSALFAPFYEVLIWGAGPTALAAGAMGLLLVWRHRGNIRKLLDGSESRLGQKKREAAVAPRPGRSAQRNHGAKP